MRTADHRRALIIGLDGATLDLIRPWARQKLLPTFSLLLDGGTCGPLRSTIQPASPPAWVTFRTGVNPGKHGVFDFQVFRIDRPFTPSPFQTVPYPAFWELLAQRWDKRVCLLNVPFTFPAKPIRGRIVAGFPITGPREHMTYPSDLLGELERYLDEYRVDVRTNLDSGPYVSHEQFIQDIMTIVTTRAQAALYLLSRYPWDLGVVVFTMPDRVQNVYWQYADPDDPRPSAAERRRFGEVILDVYRVIDRFLSQALDLLGDSGLLLIMSDHGFGPMLKDVNLNRWLADEGFLVPGSTGAGVERWARRLKTLGKRVLPRSFVQMVRGYRRTARSKRPGLPLSDTMPIDWTKTKAFALGKFGNILINLKGREPYGIVAPGADYEAVRSSIIDRLTAWRNPITGRPMVKRAYRREEVYHGRFVHQAPDILIEWEDYRYVGFRPASPRDPLLLDPARGSYEHLGWSGNHRPEGVLIAYGPDVPKGEEIKGASIQDLAPTVLHYMVQAVPDYMDGQVLLRLFTRQFATSSPVRIESGSILQPDQDDTALTDEERQQLEEHLRSLGYL